MNATVPLNRVGAHFDSAPTSKLALPQGERARGQLWSDAVFEAVQALRIQLHSRSEPVGHHRFPRIIYHPLDRVGTGGGKSLILINGDASP